MRVKGRKERYFSKVGAPFPLHDEFRRFRNDHRYYCINDFSVLPPFVIPNLFRDLVLILSTEEGVPLTG